MKNQPQPQVDRSTTPQVHRGSPSGFGVNTVDRKLDEATQKLVRDEKYASALIVCSRVSRELEAPLTDLEWHIAMLEMLVERQPKIQQMLAGLRRDRQTILNTVQRLQAITPPSEGVE